MNISLVDLKDNSEQSIGNVNGVAHIEGSDCGVLIIHIGDRFFIIDVSNCETNDGIDAMDVDDNGELILPEGMELIYSNF